MAIVKGPAFSAQASGNVCGLNYTTWRGLQIVRCAWTGTVPNTPDQVIQQNYLKTVSKKWGGLLSIENRKAWNEAAKNVVWKGRFGDPYIPNGYQLFMKLNIRRYVIEEPLMLTPPGAQEWVYVLRLKLISYPGARITIMLIREEPAVYLESYGVEYYRAGPYDSGGRRPIEGDWRFLDREVPPSFYFDFDLIEDKWYWFRSRQISKFGDVGNWFQEQVQFA